MDAKLGDWVVTPRRGKAVEINALWYNALRLMEKWMQEENLSSGAIEIGKARRYYREALINSFGMRRQDTCMMWSTVKTVKTTRRAGPINCSLYRYPITVLDQAHWQSVFQTIKDRAVDAGGA